MASAPIGLAVYRLATMALAPAFPFFLRQRAKRGKEDPERMVEKLGRTGVARPAGRLVWIHGASVGECVSALPLVEALMKAGHNVLVSSGTVTSARMMAARLPDGAIHQYAPLDSPDAVRRFLDHWQPNAALFVDSEVWPNMLRGAKARGVKLAMINGRMSERSFRGWKRAPRAAAWVLGMFDVCLAQDAASANRLTLLGARNVQISGSLKADALPLPAATVEFAALKTAVGERPVLLASQTHPGEDETVLPAHDILRAQYPDLLTVLVPRHPERGAAIEMLAGARATRRRSLGQLPAADTAVYVADTLGELGLFYRIAPFCFIGGTLVPMGGHNPLEAARLRCAVLFGPHTESFPQAYEALTAAQGGGCVRSSADIAAMAAKLIGDPALVKTMGDAAFEAAGAMGGAVAKTFAVVEALLGHARA